MVEKFSLKERRFFANLSHKYLAISYTNETEKNGVRIAGNGVDLKNLDLAISKSVGEFLERYYTFEISKEDRKYLIEKKISYLGENSIKHFRDYHDFSANQYEAFPKRKIIDSESNLLMAPVKNLFDNKNIFYPAQYIFWGNKENFKEEKFLANVTTSGCAGGFSLDSATLSAIYENVERDSFFCYWLTKSVPKIIDIDISSIAIYEKLLQVIQNTDYKIFVLDTTTDLNISSCICVLYNPISGGLCVSGSCNVNMQKAIENSVTEIVSSLSLLNFPPETVFNLENYQPFITRGIGRKERLELWANETDFSKINFLLSGEKKKLSTYEQKFFLNKKEELDFVINIFKNKKNEYENIYQYQVKSRFLQKLGFYVVRVVIPKLYPLYLSENQAFTESLRLKEFNLWKNGVEIFNVNTDPHPFP